MLKLSAIGCVPYADRMCLFSDRHPVRPGSLKHRLRPAERARSDSMCDSALSAAAVNTRVAKPESASACAPTACETAR